MELSFTQTVFSAKTVVHVRGKNLDAFPKKNTSSRPILLIVDRSGSMSGESFRCLKEAIQSKFRDVTKNHPILFFNTTTTTVGNLKELQRINAEGGTSFAVALETATRILQKNPKVYRNVDVLFLTDGEDFSGGYQDQQFQRCIQGLEGHIHVIGYGASHDLNRMMQLVGPKELKNTYQFCENAKMLIETIHNVVNHNSSIDIPLKHEQGETIISFDVGVKDGETEFILDKPLGESSKISYLNKTASVITVQPTIDEKLSFLEGLLSSEDNIEHDVVKMIQSECEGILVKETDRSKRKELLTNLMHIKQLVNNKIIKNAQTQSETEVFDGDVAERARQFAKARAIPSKSRRMLIIRSQKLLDKKDSAIQICNKNAEEASRNIKESNDTSLPEDLDPCELSMMNAIELAVEADCLGIPVEINRPDVSMVVPSLVQMIGVAPHLFSFSSFRELVVKSNNITDYNQVASLMKNDRYFSTTFNAILPLYINEAHWSVAKHYWPIACGWVVGLDERLGEWEMVGPVVCSLAYWFLLESLKNNESESQKVKNLKRHLWNTLIHLSKEPSCAKYVTNLFEKCDSGRMNKTEIPNLRSLVGAKFLLGHTFDENFQKIVALEGLRRQFSSRLDANGVWSELCSMFSDAHDHTFITQTNLWQTKIVFIPGQEIKVDFDERTAFIAWALRNSIDDKIELWTCNHQTLIDDYDQECKNIYSQTRARIETMERKAITSMANYNNAKDWISGEYTSFTLQQVGIRHIYENSFLGQVLKIARGRKQRFPKGKEKYDFLTKDLKVKLCASNSQAFY